MKVVWIVAILDGNNYAGPDIHRLCRFATDFVIFGSFATYI